MQGWKLFKHALRMVTGNWREALKIFLLPSVATMAFTAVFIFILAFLQESGFGSVLVTMVGLVGFFLFLCVLFWPLVNWHRFVLLEELPRSWVPTFHEQRVLSYLGNVVILWLLTLVVMIPLALIIFLSFSAGFGKEVFWGLTPLYCFLAVLWLSVSIILPAAAVGKPLRIREALAATNGAGWTLFLLLILVGILQIFLEFIGQIISVLPDYVEMPVLAVGVAFWGLLNVSILTTLYGHYVEGRSLD
ncbi:hypothetical protein [Shimia marina]|uniref:Uncharacterized protein n=1 Tax=Shimia marina TaxID=321267 RepID=A0A0P1ENB3_9RHOB|nr:hypothetical protein [Shimia marina]CUH51488.1 hypothetical protein SHM7688_00925 [Shimia marina]SFD47848.1 hypothetical protein SAMN04488037_101181 [Shimia marina]